MAAPVHHPVALVVLLIGAAVVDDDVRHDAHVLGVQLGHQLLQLRLRAIRRVEVVQQRGQVPLLRHAAPAVSPPSLSHFTGTLWDYCAQRKRPLAPLDTLCLVSGVAVYVSAVYAIGTNPQLQAFPQCVCSDTQWTR